MLQCNLLHVKQRHQFSTGVGRGGALPLVLGDAEPPWGLSEAETPPAGVGRGRNPSRGGRVPVLMLRIHFESKENNILSLMHPYASNIQLQNVVLSSSV